ncbi:hypothetical protein NKH77_21375 [Streptomyces sp. M19]
MHTPRSRRTAGPAPIRWWRSSPTTCRSWWTRSPTNCPARDAASMSSSTRRSSSGAI